MRRSLSIPIDGLQIRHLLPVLGRFPDLGYSRSAGYATLYFEEGPEHPICPEPVTPEESHAYQMVQMVEIGKLDAKAIFLPDVWKEYKRLAKEVKRKQGVNHAASLADCEHEQKLVEELRQLIRDTQSANPMEAE